MRNAAPYGPAVFIYKEDCIAHVTKRMGSNLRSIITKYKGRLEKIALPCLYMYIYLSSILCRVFSCLIAKLLIAFPENHLV